MIIYLDAHKHYTFNYSLYFSQVYCCLDNILQ